MTPHPIAELFPEMRNGEFAELLADIQEHGLRNPIVVTEGMILDGRNRWRACQQLGIEPATTEWDRRGSPEAFVVSENLHRRHLTDPQRALIAAKLADMRRGTRTDKQQLPAISPEVSQAKAAALLQVSERTLRDAKVIQTNAVPEVVTKVEDGTIPIAVALDITKMPAEEQRQVVQKIKASDDMGRAVRKHVPRKASPPMRKNKAGVMLPVKPAMSDKEEQRKERQRFQAALWSQLKTGIDNLCGLPKPEDVAAEVESLMRRYPIADKVNRAAMWLRSFEEIINGK